MEGGNLDISDKYSFDAPQICSEDDWDKLKSDFNDSCCKIYKLVEQPKPAELDESFVQKEYGSLMRNIDVIIEHTYYHFGQLMLIKKILSEKP